MKTIFIFVLLLGYFISHGQTIELYGGTNHEVYLGCLNCSKHDVTSIWNEFGLHGNKHGVNSIWNQFGTYGNKYGQFSPWNEYTNQAPILVDKEGNFYGYFSVNKYHNKRTQVEFALSILDNFEYVLANLDEIRKKMN